MKTKLLLSEMFNDSKSKDIEEVFLPEITRKLLPVLNWLNSKGNPYLSLESNELELKLQEAFMQTFYCELSNNEFSQYMQHKHLKQGGCLYYFTLFNTISSINERLNVGFKESEAIEILADHFELQ